MTFVILPHTTTNTDKSYPPAARLCGSSRALLSHADPGNAWFHCSWFYLCEEIIMLLIIFWNLFSVPIRSLHFFICVIIIPLSHNTPVEGTAVYCHERPRENPAKPGSPVPGWWLLQLLLCNCPKAKGARAAHWLATEERQAQVSPGRHLSGVSQGRTKTIYLFIY